MYFKILIKLLNLPTYLIREKYDLINKTKSRITLGYCENTNCYISNYITL